LLLHAHATSSDIDTVYIHGEAQAKSHSLRHPNLLANQQIRAQHQPPPLRADATLMRLMLANVQYSYSQNSQRGGFLLPSVLLSGFTSRVLVWPLLPSLQHFGAHLDQPILGVAVRERGNGFNGFVNVVLRQSTGLLEAGAGEDDFAGLYRLVQSPRFR